MKHLLVAAYKPSGMSSNFFLTQLKKRVGEKKAGYTGTLDPFARGLLVVGFGHYTRLLPFIDAESKRYRATLWLGANSQTLDVEGLDSVSEIAPFSYTEVLDVIESLKGEVSYTPPRFSAKHINGTRAYRLARKNIEFNLKPATMVVYDITLLSYRHPFVYFEVCVSKGGYVRSLGEIIANKLGARGVLYSLCRVSEGNITLKNPQRGHYIVDLGNKMCPFYLLDVKSVLSYPSLELYAYKHLISNGVKFSLENVKSGIYKTYFEDFFSIIEVLANKEVRYLYNRIPYADTLEKTR